MALKPIGILTLRKDALEVPVNYDLIWSDLILNQIQVSLKLES